MAFSPNGGALRPGQPLVVLATVVNDGESSTNGPFTVTFYAGGQYIGIREVSELGGKQAANIAFVWNRPQSGINEIRAIIDERDDIKEADEENNTCEGLTPEMYVRLPELVVESVETDPPSNMAEFGDMLTTTVRLKNNGEAPISNGFTTGLFVNGRQVGSFTT